ncbi:hypothetical protein DL96DRAFT_1823414 [Flagelloscypha sp. PMI_526]|nr:hypothetical protein DL96DRAFT_1823414 [Flagelloscypha sp. PMI_526]
MSLGPSYIRLIARNTDGFYNGADSLSSLISDHRVRQVDTSFVSPNGNEAVITGPSGPPIVSNGFPENPQGNEGSSPSFNPTEFYNFFDKRKSQALIDVVLLRDLWPGNDNDDDEASLKSDFHLSVRNLLRALDTATVGNID